MITTLVATLVAVDRRNEWELRREQSVHRLDLAEEITRNALLAVRADALYLADQQQASRFAEGDISRRSELEVEYANFLRRKGCYDQIRVINMNGEETLRLNFAGGQPVVVPAEELQDKEDRYYFRESLGLRPGEVYLSDFDLNLEHGRIEVPLKPVIRCVAPIASVEGNVRSLLVLNFLGAPLLEHIDVTSHPGTTLMLNAEGEYLRGPHAQDAWGWLLGHERSFPRQFPEEWQQLQRATDTPLLTRRGAFLMRRVDTGRVVASPDGLSPTRTAANRTPASHQQYLRLLAYVPREAVFGSSRRLLARLCVLAICAYLPIVVVTGYWSRASLARAEQSRQLAHSEEHLRQLSSRLLRIQEEERRAISREIHDELGQQATAIQLDLKLAARNLPTTTDSNAAAPHLERALREAESLLACLHDFARRVRPAVLDDLGLRDALESHLWEFSQRSGIAVDSLLDFPSQEIPDNIADNTFRLVQESLHNVLKHAEATRVCVQVVWRPGEAMPSPRGTGALPAGMNIVIQDDGKGCWNESPTTDRLGWVGMRERVDLLGGTFQIQPAAPSGTRLEFLLPAAASPPAASVVPRFKSEALS